MERRHQFTAKRLLVEIVLLVALGFLVDVVAASLGIDVATVLWIFVRFAIMLAAMFTFLPSVVDFILDIITVDKSDKG